MKADKRPNILILYCDQLRADSLGYASGGRVKTPSIDSLATDGVQFSHAYTPSPVCVPARASMMYGQYPNKTLCSANSCNMPMDGRPSFVERLTNAGYVTHGIGKCHFTPDLNALRGFETRETQEEIRRTVEEDDYLSFLRANEQEIRDPHGTRAEMVYYPQSSQLSQEYHPTQWIGDRSTAFINEQKTNDKPWFLFSSFIHPHPPYAPPSPWDVLYDVDAVGDAYIPRGHETMQSRQNQTQLEHYYIDSNQGRTFWKILRSRYYSCISFVDYQIGKIIKTLKETGQYDNTVIIFTSDHGDMLGDYGLVGKQNMLNASVCIPLVMKLVRNRNSGEVVTTPVSLVDIAPTCLQLAGCSENPSYYDGIDLHDVIHRRESYTNRTVFSQFRHGDHATYMVADSNWKYILRCAENKEYLFNINDFEVDENNCIYDENQQITRIRRLLEEYIGNTSGPADDNATDNEYDAHFMNRNRSRNPWANYITNS